MRLLGCSAYVVSACDYPFPTALNSPLAALLATEAGISPRRATFFSCSCKQRRQKNTPRLSASLRFATGKPASRHSGCGAAKLALRYARRSNRLPQICSRGIGTLRCQCPQPEPRAAGADTRVGAGTDGLRELRRNQPLALIPQAVAAIKNTKKLSGTRIRYCPLCPCLRRRPLVARGCTAECSRIVL